MGLQTDKGFPVVIPLAYGRVGDDVYLHGSAASRLFRGARTPTVEICMTVTFVDGLVVARSTYNTDINYRSVVIIGERHRGEGPGREATGPRAPGGAHHPGPEPRRPTTHREGASQHHAAAASHRPSPRPRSARAGPLDDDDDYDLDIWAGVIPLIDRMASRAAAIRPGACELRASTPPTYVAALPTDRPAGGATLELTSHRESEERAMCGVVGLLMRDRASKPSSGRCWSR